jgi:hypothetical protein
MKTKIYSSLIASLVLMVIVTKLFAAEPNEPRRYEYATIRWSGKENIQIIRPDGEVEFVSYEIRKARKPEKSDERTFYMNVVLNTVAKEGYELAAISGDEMILKKILKTRQL